jgi:beta-lactamase class A
MLAQTPRVSLDARMKATLAKAPGSVYSFAKNLDTGASYGVRADERVRAASTIKLALMIATFSAVEGGTARWDEPLTFGDAERIQGAGVLHEFSNGVQLPLRDLMHLMIVVSDNSATNLIIDRFGCDAANAEMDKLGLKNSRMNRKVLGSASGDGWSKAGLEPENQKFGLGVTTSREMVTLLEKMERGEVVSPAASKEMLEIMRRQQLKDGIGRRMGDLVASKSGSLDHLRSDVGVVYSKHGRIAMAITVDGLKRVDYGPDNAGNLFIADLADLLVERLGR